MKVTQKLYRVTLIGMNNSLYKVSYVVTTDCNKAYQKVKSFLDKNDLGFSKERELDKVELVAENYQYTNTETILFLDDTNDV